MGLDPAMKEALLGTFTNMAKECADQGASGPDYDDMCAHLDRMEQLANEISDMNEFNGIIMQENLYVKFSNCYGRVLSAKAIAEQEEGGYDDGRLLKQSIDALKGAIVSLEQGKKDAIELTRSHDAATEMNKGMDLVERQTDLIGSKRESKRVRKKTDKEINEALNCKPNMGNNDVEIDILINHEPIVSAIKELIALGEQDGMTLPKFLKIQMEKGLDKAMEGSVLVRDAYIYELGYAEAMMNNPHEIEKRKDNIKAFDELASKSPFGVPETAELNFSYEMMERKHELNIITWDEIVNRWEALIEDLSHWSLSYTKIAPHIDPWKGARNPKQAAIDIQNIQPGLFKERARLFEEYFGLTFQEMFHHPSFKWKVEKAWITESQEFIEFLIEKVYPQCKPFNHLDAETISERQQFMDEKREMNPESHIPLTRYMSFYDAKFGEGRYLTKFDAPVLNGSKAVQWNWESFKSNQALLIFN